MNETPHRLAHERLTREIIERIRPSCPGLTEAELMELAIRMAELQLKYLGQG